MTYNGQTYTPRDPLSVTGAEIVAWAQRQKIYAIRVTALAGREWRVESQLHGDCLYLQRQSPQALFTQLGTWVITDANPRRS